MNRKPRPSRDVSAAAAAMARKRLYSMTSEERKQLASKAGLAAWKGMSPQQRRLEGLRRAASRRRNRMKLIRDTKV